jgi:hypothetical protein
MKSGAEQLIDWMERRFPESTRKQRDTAEHFEWDETFIAKLVTGARLPGLVNALRIERETGIPVEAWVSSELDTPVSAAPERARKSR